VKNLNMQRYHWEHPVPEHKRNNYGLFYVLRGEGYISMGDQKHKIGPGDVLLCFPLENHGYFPLMDQFIDAYYLTFEEDESDKSLHRDLTLLEGERFFTKTDSRHFFNHLADLLKKKNLFSRREAEYGVKAYLYSLLAEKKEEAYEPQSDLFDNIIECLYTDYSITLKELAARFSISQESIRLLFKEKIGDTPMHYMMAYKIELVAHRLKTTNQSLKELAELYSFSDSYHLSRTFKHFKGVSPREFKESSDYI
jgi:AraC-like DNA-binding protein